MAYSLDEWRGRFWEKVDVREENQCWEWRGSIAANGYGSFRLPRPTKEVIGAHRISYFLANDGIPSGMLVRHKCDNPKCVNPNHLEPGDKRDNARDMVERGRATIRDQRGEKNGAAKLTLEQVSAIRQMVARGMRNTEIACQFNVSHQLISRIKLGKAWAVN